jgi:hypothetical protein
MLDFLEKPIRPDEQTIAEKDATNETRTSGDAAAPKFPRTLVAVIYQYPVQFGPINTNVPQK